MSTFERRYYQYFIRSNEVPGWMKDERYEYCEPSTKKSRRKGARFYGLLSALTLMR